MLFLRAFYSGSSVIVDKHNSETRAITHDTRTMTQDTRKIINLLKFHDARMTTEKNPQRNESTQFYLQNQN